MDMKKSRVFVVEDEALILESYCSLLKVNGFEVVGTACTGKQALQRFQNLEKGILQQLESAVQKGVSFRSEAAHAIVLLHKEWLEMTWKQYTAEAHQGIAAMYLADERFRLYYDRKIDGCAVFLEAAIRYWVKG